MPLLPFVSTSGAPTMAITNYLELPLPLWSAMGAAVYTVSYWLRASRRGRDPKTLTNRTAATFLLASLGGLPVSYLAVDLVDHQWAWTHSWPSIPPVVATVTGLVGHKILTLMGERLLGWAKSDKAAELLKDINQP